ncbi:MAG: hypothetical protein ABI761_14725 [Saprospiraceae bacterium]
MKTFIHLITGICICSLLIIGCTPDPITPNYRPTLCTTCKAQSPPPLYDLSVGTYSPYKGFTVFTATLDGDFPYPAVLNWYRNFKHYRRLYKSDTLTPILGNRSFYYCSWPDPDIEFYIDCEAILSNGETITKSIYQ